MWRRGFFIAKFGLRNVRRGTRRAIYFFTMRHLDKTLARSASEENTGKTLLALRASIAGTLPRLKK